ncbi:hypothetical protein MTR_4g095048 [Medicago truncatula]|uniref:Uncharacterized protein n=1 Tax=Medicago truncatula TaxID=3880 RepID=A0A072UNV3_MEDTR|nr:hypothetical protein MTR_4g095048 [Medicago truncatula]
MVASDFTDEFNYANRFEGAAEPAAQTVEKWCPPPFGMVKLNVDAEVINDGHIGCGMVIGVDFGFRPKRQFLGGNGCGGRCEMHSRCCQPGCY